MSAQRSALTRRMWLAAMLTVAAAACEEAPVQPDFVSPDLAIIGGEDVSQVFIVTNTNDAGPGSLRQAIDDANAAPGRDGIAFEIPGSGPHTIAVESPLPGLFDAAVIDGFTQPGASPNTNSVASGSNAVLQIHLDGSAMGGPTVGLQAFASNTTIRGLAVTGFGYGVALPGSMGRVEGSYIGVDPSGTSALPNREAGVLVTGADNVVGGSDPAQRNVISGNLADGVLMAGPGALRNVVSGSYIGTDASGKAAIPNGLPEPDPQLSAAVHIIGGASNNVVGGDSAMPCDGSCNVVSGNHRTGVWIESGTNNAIAGNLIGMDASGAEALGNDRWGIVIGNNPFAGPSNDNRVTANRIEWNGRTGMILVRTGGNTIGGFGVTPGTCDGPCNRIANNGLRDDVLGAGIYVHPTAGVGNSILGNSITDHERALGIDIAVRGPDFNDFGDFDVGPNDLQNYPELVSATQGRRQLEVEGFIDTQSPETVLIELYANETADPTGYGEGDVFLGYAVPEPSGEFTALLPPVGAGTLISATATNFQGSTSEFSTNVAVVPSRGPSAEDNDQFFPFSFQVGTCTEPVHVSGSYHVISRFQQTPTGRIQGSFHITAIGIGVGAFTGSLYTFNNNINQQESFTFDSPQQVFTSEESLLLTGRGDAEDFRLNALFHVVVTPDGSFDITADRFEVNCS
jgi:hypothetical protein